MNSQKIIEYVMNTPSNTNPAILRQMLDSNGNSSGGTVKSVNKILPDELGNVEIGWDDLGRVENAGGEAGKVLLAEYDFGEIIGASYEDPYSYHVGSYTLDLPVDENGDPYPSFDFIVSVNGEEHEVSAVLVPPAGPTRSHYNIDLGAVALRIYFTTSGYGDGSDLGTYTFEGANFREDGFYNIALYHAQTGESVTIVPMPEEYMPLLTSPNGTKWKLVVADDGTVTATAI